MHYIIKIYLRYNKLWQHHMAGDCGKYHELVASFWELDPIQIVYLIVET